MRGRCPTLARPDPGPGRLARRPLFEQRPSEVGDFLLPAYPGLNVKDGYCRWPERDLAGNAIDFFMRVLGLSFHDAMRQITGR